MADVDKEIVWKMLIDRLKDMNYFKDIRQGGQQYILDGLFPCLRVTLEGDTEHQEDFPKRRSDQLRVFLSAQLDIRERLNDMIVGDEKDIGILRLEHNIKKAVESDDFRFTQGGVPYVQNYSLTVLDYPTFQNAIKEVQVLVEFQLRIFSAESRL